MAAAESEGLGPRPVGTSDVDAASSSEAGALTSASRSGRRYRAPSPGAASKGDLLLPDSLAFRAPSLAHGAKPARVFPEPSTSRPGPTPDPATPAPPPPRRFKVPMAAALAALFVVGLLVASVGIVVLNFFLNREAVIATAVQTSQRIAQSVRVRVQDTIAEDTHTALLLASRALESGRLSLGRPVEIAATLAGHMARTSVISYLYVGFESGDFFGASRAAAAGRPGAFVWHFDVANLSEPRVDPTLGLAPDGSIDRLHPIYVSEYDPATRPWFQSALQSSDDCIAARGLAPGFGRRCAAGSPVTWGSPYHDFDQPNRLVITPSIEVFLPPRASDGGGSFGRLNITEDGIFASLDYVPPIPDSEKASTGPEPNLGRAVLGADIFLDSMQVALKEAKQTTNTLIFITARDAEGRVMAASDDSAAELLQPACDAASPVLRAAHKALSPHDLPLDSYAQTSFRLGSEVYRAMGVPLTLDEGAEAAASLGGGLAVYVVLPESDLVEGLQRTTAVSMGAAAAIVALFGASVLLAALLITRPLRQLSKQMDAIAHPAAEEETPCPPSSPCGSAPNSERGLPPLQRPRRGSFGSDSAPEGRGARRSSAPEPGLKAPSSSAALARRGSRCSHVSFDAEARPAPLVPSSASAPPSADPDVSVSSAGALACLSGLGPPPSRVLAAPSSMPSLPSAAAAARKPSGAAQATARWIARLGHRPSRGASSFLVRRVDPAAVAGRSLVAEIAVAQDAFRGMCDRLQSVGKYLAHGVIEPLHRTGRLGKIGLEERELTVFFADIAGFTTLSESIAPERLVTYLQLYLTAASQAVQAHNGTVDKFLGDGIMAFWNAPSAVPQHPLAACRAASDFLGRLEAMGPALEAQGLPPFHVRVGINSGSALVGNVGSDDRMNYTCIGDTVNLASRLESLGKYYGVATIVSESVYKAARDTYLCRLLDRVVVQGRSQPALIYELLRPFAQAGPEGPPAPAPAPAALEPRAERPRAAALELCERYEVALRALWAGELPAALAAFRALAADRPVRPGGREGAESAR